MKDNNNKSVAALTHLSVFSQYIIPFGNFIVPLIIWLTNKKDELVNHHGKGVINFQLSIFLYSIIASIITLPIFLFTIFKNMSLSHLLDDPDYVIEHISIANLSGIVIMALTIVFLFVVLKILEIFLVIYGAIKASNGENWKYPFTIKFVK